MRKSQPSGLFMTTYLTFARCQDETSTSVHRSEEISQGFIYICIHMYTQLCGQPRKQFCLPNLNQMYQTKKITIKVCTNIQKARANCQEHFTRIPSLTPVYLCLNAYSRTHLVSIYLQWVVENLLITSRFGQQRTEYWNISLSSELSKKDSQ